MTYWEFEGYLKYSPLFYGYGERNMGFRVDLEIFGC